MSGFKPGFLGLPKPLRPRPDRAAAPELLSVKTAFGGRATIEFGSADFDWTEFSMLRFTLMNMRPATNGSVLLGRISQDGGGSFKSGATDYLNAFTGYSTANLTYVVNSTSTGLNLTDLTQGQTNSAIYVGKFDLDLAMPYDVVHTKVFRVESAYPANVGAPDYVIGHGTYTYGANQLAINGMQFLYSGGSAIAEGNCYVYGITRRDRTIGGF